MKTSSRSEKCVEGNNWSCHGMEILNFGLELEAAAKKRASGETSKTPQNGQIGKRQSESRFAFPFTLCTDDDSVNDMLPSLCLTVPRFSDAVTFRMRPQ